MLTYWKKPITTNTERAGNRWGRAESTKEWRETFTWLARKEKIPAMKWINVTAQPFQKMGRLQDTAACNPSVKAAIDGLVDAGVIPDDSGEYVRMIIFMPPLRGADRLTLMIEGEINATTAA